MKIRTIALALLGLFLVIQLIPYGRDHDNPPVVAEPEWNSPETRALFFRVCRDCHSNETRWPWYSAVAPVSWLLQHDVEEARSHFNVSEWGQNEHDHSDDAAEELEEGEMPPWYYLPLHSDAKLSPRDRQLLINGLEQTFGSEDSHHGAESRHGHEAQPEANHHDGHEQDHEPEPEHDHGSHEH